MITKPRNYDSAKAMTQGGNRLVPGGYICEIKAADYIQASGSAGARIIIHYDIAEGEYKDYWTNQYKNNTNEDKKWKGNYTLWMPDDSGDEKDQRANRILKTFVEAVEESNAGYHWDWDESKLKGKKLGLIICNKFWSFNGKTGFAPEVNFCVTVDKIKAGDFTIPDDYIPNNLMGEYEASKGTPMEAPTDGFMSIPDGIEGSFLPFK